MNEKWFAYAISLSIMLIFINAFITMGAGLLDSDGNQISLLSNSTNNSYSYDSLKAGSNFSISGVSGDSSQSPTTEQGYQPVKRTDGDSASMNSFDIIINLGFGVEIIMLQLALIFNPVAAIFYAIAGFVFFIKTVALTWLASIVVRQIFFGRVF